MTRMTLSSLAVVSLVSLASLAACTQSSATTAVVEQPAARGCGPEAACTDGAVADNTALTSVSTGAEPMEHEGGCGMHGATEPSAHTADAPKAASDPTVTAAFTSAPQPGAKAKCVVMDRDFVIEKNTPTTTYNGKTYAFCCDGCKEMFDKDPAKFAALAEQHDKKQPHG